MSIIRPKTNITWFFIIIFIINYYFINEFIRIPINFFIVDFIIRFKLNSYVCWREFKSWVKSLWIFVSYFILLLLLLFFYKILFLKGSLTKVWFLLSFFFLFCFLLILKMSLSYRLSVCCLKFFNKCVQ